MSRIFGISIIWCLFGFYSYAQETFKAEVRALKKLHATVPDTNLILFTGSSSIRLWPDLQQSFPQFNVLNTGFGGSQMSDLLYYAKDLIYDYHPEQIFIYEGDNDLSAGKSPEAIIEDAEKLLSGIRSNVGNISVCFITPKPSISRWDLRSKYIDLIKRLSDWEKTKANVTIIDVWTPMLEKDGNLRRDLFVEDGLHMNEKGYAIWTSVIGKYLDPTLLVR